MLIVSTTYSSLFFIWTICIFIGNRFSFLRWLGLLSMKFLYASLIYIDHISTLEWYGHNTRALPVLLILGRQKSLDLNSIIFGSTDYTGWNTIGNKILKLPDTAWYFKISGTVFQLKRVGIMGRLLTDTLSTILIRIRACLPFLSL